MAINFFDFEGRLCTAVPWQRKKIVRFFDYILRANPDVSEKHLKDYVPMYIGDLRDRFREEEIDYLKWMSLNIQLMQDMNNIIKATLVKTTTRFDGNVMPPDFFYKFGYIDFFNLSSVVILKQFGMGQSSYADKILNDAKQLINYMNSINEK